MELHTISPVDGRYRRQTANLAAYFSEFSLIRYRVLVEIEYFIALCKIPSPPLSQLGDLQIDKYVSSLRNIYRNFSNEDAETIKDIEKTTNHDVKAVEYFIKDKFLVLGLAKYVEFIHFGLTSQDINNTAIPLSLKEAFEKEMEPNFQQLLTKLDEFSELWATIPMLAHTHGQPASPTSVGKELRVFVYRLKQQWQYFRLTPYAAKFGGATGNFNAHTVAYPQNNWQEFGNHFVSENLGLSRSIYTTQIENYDHLAAFFDTFSRINTILIDLSRDIWAYISMGYFKQKIKANEVGSSAMPHKVNPIDFENAEGNLGIANALFNHFSQKLPISRLQRDLTDSTVLRNIGVPLAHTLIAFKSLLKGLDKLELNETKINTELEANWAVVSEAIQTILRRENYPQPYETLKKLTRTSTEINAKIISNFINELEIHENIKTELRNITPFNYVGNV
jgi:adenylosuccinate lyase